MNCRSFLIGLMLAVTACCGFTAVTMAGEPVPFNGKLEGLHVSRTPLAPKLVSDVFETTGNASQQGQFDLVLEAVVNFVTLPPTAEGVMTFTAANGDRLVADFKGSSALVVPGTVLITEHAIIDADRSTGRFAGASGTFAVSRLADAATGVGGVTSGSFKGMITLATPLNP